MPRATLAVDVSTENTNDTRGGEQCDQVDGTDQAVIKGTHACDDRQR